MADAKICDRCGKTIVATRTAEKLGFAAWKYSIFDRNNSFRTTFDRDLCVECAEKMLRFLDGYGLVDISDNKEL